MTDYYKVLGVEPGATPQQIKKAYFSLVRTYSPEKDPEKFREIREAYENLQKPSGETGPSFPEMTDPYAVMMLKAIVKNSRAGNKAIVRNMCEEAHNKFPDEIQFLYLTAIAQRKAGNTGKAVKSCELLVKKEPENKWFWRELAISYIERGFKQKAFSACEKAYELGCRDNDFILMFSINCNDYEEYDTGCKILLELVRQNRKWDRNEIPEVLEAYSGLLVMDLLGGLGNLKEILELLCGFVKKYSIYIDENMELLSTMIALLAIKRHCSLDEMKEIDKLVAIMEQTSRSLKSRQLCKALKETCLIQFMEKDERLSNLIFDLADAVFGMSGMDSQLKKYALLDAKLCMIAERQEILPQLEILRTDYPYFYDAVREFAEQLQSGKNLENLKTSLLKQYVRLSESVDGGYYFKKYPEEKKRFYGKLIYESTEDVPYVRSEKKVGRNDPCPCGSGKKYKHCCGR